MIKICGIYKITSPTEKIYIGQSANIKSRITDYKNARCKCQQKLYGSIIKHGWDTHIFELIHECQEFELNYLEAYYIKLYDTFNTEHGMNLTSGGDHYKMSNETKLKIGAASKLRVCSEETRKKLSENSSRSFLGKHHSEESKEKLRTAHIGKKLTEEHIQNLSDSHKGYRATEEQKQKMGEAHLGNTNCLGHKLTKEHIEKIIEGRKWYKPSEETINKIIESNKYRDRKSVV